MKTIQIGNEQYKLKFGFDAAENKDVVQRMFNALSMSYIGKRLDLDGNNSKVEVAAAMIDGTADLVSDMPLICRDAFYAGLLEHHKGITVDESKELMKQYMTENKLSFKGLYEEIKEMMEDDGFFDLTGLTEMVEEMNQTEEKPKRQVKKPQDHQKKSTSTK